MLKLPATNCDFCIAKSGRYWSHCVPSETEAWVLFGYRDFSALHRRFEALVDSLARPEKFSDELAGFAITENDPKFANTKTPKSSEFAGQTSHIALPSSIYVIESPANILSDTRM
jgi:hypothetical protein